MGGFWVCVWKLLEFKKDNKLFFCLLKYTYSVYKGAYWLGSVESATFHLLMTLFRGL